MLQLGGRSRKAFSLSSVSVNSGDYSQKNQMGRVRSMNGARLRVYRVLVGKAEERDHLEYPCIDGTIILRWISRKWDEGYGLDRSGSG